MNNRGFTLIETILYLTMFGILLGGGLVSAYSIIQTSTNNAALAHRQAEGQFILQKLRWALSDATAINSPSAGTTGSTLTVTKPDYPANPITVTWSGGVLRLQIGTEAFQDLNTTRTEVSSASFEHLVAEAGKPAGVHALFVVASQTYEITTYLKQ